MPNKPKSPPAPTRALPKPKAKAKPMPAVSPRKPAKAVKAKAKKWAAVASGPLANPKHERFVQAIVKGKTLAEAYVEAGYKPNEKNAARLKKNEGVAARLAELQAKAAEKAVVTAADIAAQLDEDRAFAREKLSPGAAVSATLGKAKVLGLIKDRHEHTGADGAPIEYRNLSDEEVDARIRAHEAAKGEQHG